jgi:YesN/AraC family two-component response regulator
MKSILIVDDDEFILLGLSKAVNAHAKNASVLTARHGKQAVEILGAHRVDLIVTDVKMPIMNGYDLVNYANTHFPGIPVYVMTGDYVPDVKPKFRTAVVEQFVSKPFSFKQLAADITDKVALAGEPVPA